MAFDTFVIAMRSRGNAPLAQRGLAESDKTTGTDSQQRSIDNVYRRMSPSRVRELELGFDSERGIYSRIRYRITPGTMVMVFRKREHLHPWNAFSELLDYLLAPRNILE